MVISAAPNTTCKSSNIFWDELCSNKREFQLINKLKRKIKTKAKQQKTKTSGVSILKEIRLARLHIKWFWFVTAPHRISCRLLRQGNGPPSIGSQGRPYALHRTRNDFPILCVHCITVFSIVRCGDGKKKDNINQLAVIVWSIDGCDVVWNGGRDARSSVASALTCKTLGWKRSLWPCRNGISVPIKP